VHLWKDYKGVDYIFEPTLREVLEKSDDNCRYPNMLGLLLEEFPDARFVAVGTNIAFEVQQEVMKHFGYNENFTKVERIVLEDEMDFTNIFSQLDRIMQSEKKVIVDISHSFRHLPILMTIQMIIENIQDHNKIKHIFFAKELEKDRRYEIIDLHDYLDLSAIAFALASFDENYTVGHYVKVSNHNYRDLLKLLRVIGTHILSNSFKVLFTHHDKQRPLVERVLELLTNLQKHPTSKPLERSLKKIEEHMQKLKDLSTMREDRMYFEMAFILYKKGYMLNAITLLDEATALYCLHSIKQLDEKFRMHIDSAKFKGKPYGAYRLSNEAKNLLKYYPNSKYPLLQDEKFTRMVIKRLRNKDFVKFKKFIQDCDSVRDDLAHGNKSKYRKDIDLEMEKLFSKYRSHCIENDILGTI
jgi:CRISPR-associated DxTHG motif protein